jgi:hypothetical protein
MAADWWVKQKEIIDLIILMKNYLMIYMVSLVLAATGCGGGSGSGEGNINSQISDTGKAIISFTEIVHDFGKVDEGEKVACIFSFQNTGTGSLVITSASATCGCTIPKYNRKPVPPGKTGTLEVIFDTSGRQGKQTKTITVNSNATVSQIFLRITAEVIDNTNN